MIILINTVKFKQKRKKIGCRLKYLLVGLNTFIVD